MDLRAANIIDPEIEGHYAFYAFVEQISTQEHRHDFFEIFLVASGSVYHHINAQSVLLSRGALVFIRPDDRHYYQPNADQNCELINLAFLRSTFHALSDYLGLTVREDLLLGPALPPTVTLTITEATQVAAGLKEWGRLMYQDRGRSRLALRALLAQIVSSVFITRVEEYSENAPGWLVELCQAMQQTAHIVEGRDALLRLAGRSPEHIGRVFKTYLGVTPSQYVSNLRLDYASELLLHTDRSVTEICYEVGFENLSYFYQCFRERWGCPPLEFRRTNRRTLIP